jgi:hypothetical protein
LRESYDLEIHDLLARQAGACDEPGDGGMKPKRGTNDLLGQVMRPVMTLDVKQFVAGYRGLECRVHGWETLGKKDYRSHEAESDGRIYMGGKTKLSAGVHARAHFFEDRGGFSESSDWRGCLPELAESQKSHRENCQSCGNTRENHGAEDLRDEWKTGEMPVREGGARCGEDANGCGVRRYNHCGDAWQAMPGLDSWQQQANGQERAPVEEQYAGLTNLEKTRKKSGGQDQQSDLGAPKDEIRKP